MCRPDFFLFPVSSQHDNCVPLQIYKLCRGLFYPQLIIEGLMNFGLLSVVGLLLCQRRSGCVGAK